ncbi:E3 ubiquitin-protein ligase ATL4-like [Hibiscus syriacus]|nr:E3 ubiquitin-protein ligase ATL4-like [Hibiscus syriacus]
MGGAGNSAVDSSSESLHSSYSEENAKRSIIAIVLILCITVLQSIFVYLLPRHLNRLCFRSSTFNITSTAASSHRVTPERPVEASFLDTLPPFTFSAITRRSDNGSTASADCAVCLSKFEPEDQLRLLPLCCHAFHSYCIDAWLTSNQTCPLCRCPLLASDSDLMKVMLQSSNAPCPNRSGRSDSFRLEIGSISHRQSGSNSDNQRRMSYSIGSFDYIVEEESQLNRSQTNQRTMSDKEDTVGVEASSEESLAAEVASGRSWLKDYVDRLSFSLSSRAMSFRSSGRLVTGSSRRSDVSGAGGEYDVEANRIGEELSEMLRWFSEV